MLEPTSLLHGKGKEKEQELASGDSDTESEGQCSICYEKPAIYGLLPGCSHVFCLSVRTIMTFVHTTAPHRVPVHSTMERSRGQGYRLGEHGEQQEVSNVPGIIQLYHSFLSIRQAWHSGEDSRHRKVQGEHGQGSMSALRTNEESQNIYVSLWQRLLLQA